jgi:hypothetical protein
MATQTVGLEDYIAEAATREHMKLYGPTSKRKLSQTGTYRALLRDLTENVMSHPRFWNDTLRIAEWLGVSEQYTSGVSVPTRDAPVQLLGHRATAQEAFVQLMAGPVAEAVRSRILYDAVKKKKKLTSCHLQRSDGEHCRYPSDPNEQAPSICADCRRPVKVVDVRNFAHEVLGDVRSLPIPPAIRHAVNAVWHFKYHAWTCKTPADVDRLKAELSTAVKRMSKQLTMFARQRSPINGDTSLADVTDAALRQCEAFLALVSTNAPGAPPRTSPVVALQPLGALYRIESAFAITLMALTGEHLTSGHKMTRLPEEGLYMLFPQLAPTAQPTAEEAAAEPTEEGAEANDVDGANNRQSILSFKPFDPCLELARTWCRTNASVHARHFVAHAAALQVTWADVRDHANDRLSRFEAIAQSRRATPNSAASRLGELADVATHYVVLPLRGVADSAGPPMASTAQPGDDAACGLAPARSCTKCGAEADCVELQWLQPDPPRCCAGCFVKDVRACGFCEVDVPLSRVLSHWAGSTHTANVDKFRRAPRGVVV